MQALAKRGSPELIILSTVPRWFFEHSLEVPFHYHPIVTDVGLVQQTSFAEDAEATVTALDSFLPFERERLLEVADLLAQCHLVVCDIAPLGIMAAKMAGVPSVLVENFTWDWIYAAYQHKCPAIGRYIDAFAKIFQQADYHVQAQPICAPAPCDLTVPPIFREQKNTSGELRRRFACGRDYLVLLTMGGGTQSRSAAVAFLEQYDNCMFVLTGNPGVTERQGNLWFLSRSSSVYHPDLVGAANLVVGKLGYSTLAEVYQAGAVFAYVPRLYFPESQSLSSFAAREMVSRSIAPASWTTGRWADQLVKLLGLGKQRHRQVRVNGADLVVDLLVRILEQDS